MDDPLLTRFGSHLGQGQVALLNYAKTLMRVPMGVFGAAMAFAAYPTLARLWVEGRGGEMYQTLSQAVRRVLVLALGSQVALTVAGSELGTLIYTTRRIPPEQMSRLGLYLGLFSLALGAWSAQALLSRGFYARGKAWFPTWLGTGVLVLSLPLYWYLGRRMGAPGLCLASAAAITVYAVLLEWKLRSEIGEGPGYRTFLARGILAGACGIAAGLLVRSWIGTPRWTVMDALWRAAVLGLCGGAAFSAAALALRVRELREILELLTGRFARRRSLPG